MVIIVEIVLIVMFAQPCILVQSGLVDWLIR